MGQRNGTVKLQLINVFKVYSKCTRSVISEWSDYLVYSEGKATKIIGPAEDPFVGTFLMSFGKDVAGYYRGTSLKTNQGLLLRLFLILLSIEQC
jgi:hypothetical protein